MDMDLLQIFAKKGWKKKSRAFPPGTLPPGCVWETVAMLVLLFKQFLLCFSNLCKKKFSNPANLASQPEKQPVSLTSKSLTRFFSYGYGFVANLCQKTLKKISRAFPPGTLPPEGLWNWSRHCFCSKACFANLCKILALLIFAKKTSLAIQRI